MSSGRAFSLTVAIAIGAGVAACSLLVDSGGIVGRPSDANADAASADVTADTTALPDGGADAVVSTTGCSGGGGPAGVHVDKTNYCIDRTDA